MLSPGNINFFSNANSSPDVSIVNGGLLSSIIGSTATTLSTINMSENIVVNSGNTNCYFQFRNTSGAKLLLGTLSSDFVSRMGTGMNNFKFQNTALSDICIINGSNGNITNTNNSYGAISDKKLKENITDAREGYLSDIMNVKIKNFNLIGTTEKQIGVVAQEIEQIFPSLVEDQTILINEVEETVKTVKMSILNTILLKAVQELTNRVIELEKKK